MSSTALKHPQHLPIQHKLDNSKANKNLHLPRTNTRQLENQAFSLLQASTTCKQITQIHARVIRNAIHQSNFVVAKLISSYFSFENPSYARLAFDQIIDPNKFLWNNMIIGFVQGSSYLEALTFYSEMLNFGCSPDNFTFPFVIKACSKLPALGEGKVIHGQVVKLGLNLDVYVQTALLDFYGSSGENVAARCLFDRMSERDVVSWNVIITGYVRCGSMEIAKELFEEMPIRNVSSWTTMIGGFVRIGNSREALVFFRRMQIDGVKPDKMAIVTVLTAIADLGTLEMGRWIHDYVEKNKIGIDNFVGTALIDMYSKCGSIKEAQLVFDGIRAKTLPCYNAMIMGFAVHGLGTEAIKVFRDAKRMGIGIDDITMIAVLTACGHSGLVDEGCTLFESMKVEYGIDPKKEHYGCMVDLLGRAGRFDKAMAIIESIDTDSFVLGTLAYACRIYGNVKLGEELARKMSELEPFDSGLLVLKSNLHAADNRWEEAAGMRRLMKDKGIQKKPGGSWIVVNNVVHEFVAGDSSHPFWEEIYCMLTQLREEMKLLGQDVLK